MLAFCHTVPPIKDAWFDVFPAWIIKEDVLYDERYNQVTKQRRIANLLIFNGENHFYYTTEHKDSLISANYYVLAPEYKIMYDYLIKDKRGLGDKAIDSLKNWVKKIYKVEL